MIKKSRNYAVVLNKEIIFLGSANAASVKNKKMRRIGAKTTVYLVHTPATRQLGITTDRKIGDLIS